MISRATIFRALGLGAVYAILSWAVQTVTALGDEASSTVFWPAAGVTVAVLLRRPRQEWPLLLGAVWVAETTLDITNDFDLWVSIAWGAANVIEPLAAAALLHRLGHHDPNLASRDGLLHFVAFAVIVGPAMGATVGAGTSVLFVDDTWWPRLPRWFVGDAIGALTIGPAVLLGHRLFAEPVSRQVLTPAIVLSGAAAVALGPWGAADGRHGLPYLVLPALVFLAIQCGPRESAIAMLLVAALVETTAALGNGPFRGDGGAIEAQMFLAMSAFSLWVVTALMEDLVERTNAAAELHDVSMRDELTGVANRRRLLLRLDELHAQLLREGTPLTLLFLDLDGFKAINDQYGHATGDAVLRTIAERLEEGLRDVDLVARVGGDEFVIVTDHCDTEADVEILADRVHAIVSEPMMIDGSALVARTSIGSHHTTTPIDDHHRLIDIADREMYRQKVLRTAAEADPQRAEDANSSARSP